MTSPTEAFLETTARQLADRLEQLKSVRIVLAESCTAGLACAALGRVPGISRFLCGSFVTYRPESKMAWLKLDPATLHQHSPESAIVTAEMAMAALHNTPEASLAAAITGHLGPDAPPARDGLVFMAVAQRNSAGEPCLLAEQQLQLLATTRTERQSAAALGLLSLLEQSLAGLLPGNQS